MPFDLQKIEDNYTAFTKVRASLEPIDTVFYWSGQCHAFIPGEPGKLLFRVQGYNIARMERTNEGFVLLSREVMIYEDPVTGQRLEKWTNPWTEEEVEVIAVQNDPVNSKYSSNPAPSTPTTRPRMLIPYTIIGSDVHWRFEVLLKYPSPLSRAEYPENSQSDEYQAAELFTFICDEKELQTESLSSVATRMTWSRVSPWLPWMRMADRPGNLIFHTSGYKVSGGFEGVPAALKEYVEAEHPEYRLAPTHFTAPNETSWTLFKKLFPIRRDSDPNISQRSLRRIDTKIV